MHQHHTRCQRTQNQFVSFKTRAYATRRNLQHHLELLLLLIPLQTSHVFIIMLHARKVCSVPIFCRNFSRVLADSGVIDIAEEVRFALQYRKPVVALESTIVTHGMPFPKNAECARGVEEVVRKQVKYRRFNEKEKALVRCDNTVAMFWFVR